MVSSIHSQRTSTKFVRASMLLAIAALAPACGGGGGGGTAPPLVLTITTASLPAGTQGAPYFAILSATSGTAPYTWTLTAGSLPQGLSLSAAGVISGTPTARATTFFSVQVTDNAAPQGSAQALLNITINAPPLVITTTSLPSGNRTVPYSAQLQATGGVQPYTWTSTPLPSGLVLGSTGFVNGTPTTSGSTLVTFTVTDSVATSANKSLTIIINNPPAVTVSGTWTFDKVPATASGLNFAGTAPTPMRYCLVGLEDQGNPGVFFSSAYTDISGNYSLPSPQSTNVKIYAFSLVASTSGSVTVVDRASTSTPKTTWSIATPNIAVGTLNVTGSSWNVPDSATHVNGAFNIADVVFTIQIAVVGLNPSAQFGAATIQFSPSFYTGTSYFQGSTGYIKGDRTTDSDDFDDTVIAHEYSHYLQTTFSRSDNIGGTHSLNQIIDPRLALAEGQATFMGNTFMGTPVYIDTSFAGAFTIDLRSAPTTNPGYWNEISVSKIFWACFDPGGSVALPFSAFWTVFTVDMPNHTFTYLIEFIDSLRARNTAKGAAIATVLGTESITYTPGGTPSVPNPWPYFLPTGVTLASTLDSSVSQQSNLMKEANVFYITIPSGQSVTVSVTNTGPGPSPAAPRYVSLYVFNDTGHGYSPNGKLYAFKGAPAGTGYTYSTTFTLPSAGAYGIVATTAYPYPPAGGGSPTIFSSADYTITATY